MCCIAVVGTPIQFPSQFRLRKWLSVSFPDVRQMIMKRARGFETLTLSAKWKLHFSTGWCIMLQNTIWYVYAGVTVHYKFLYLLFTDFVIVLSRFAFRNILLLLGSDRFHTYHSQSLYFNCCDLTFSDPILKNMDKYTSWYHDTLMRLPPILSFTNLHQKML